MLSELETQWTGPMTLPNLWNIVKKIYSLIIDFDIIPQRASASIIHPFSSRLFQSQHFYYYFEDESSWNEGEGRRRKKNDKSDFNNWRKICFLFSLFLSLHFREEIERKAEKCLFNSKHLQCNSKRKWEKNNDSLRRVVGWRAEGDGEILNFLSCFLANCLRTQNVPRASKAFNFDFAAASKSEFESRLRNLLINLRW